MKADGDSLATPADAAMRAATARRGARPG